MKISNKISSKPYMLFYDLLIKAKESHQEAIESILIASFDKEKNEVDSRYVNLKFITNDEFIFFSNYNSPKASSFNSNQPNSCIIYWPSINAQIRMKAKIKKTSKVYNQKYFYE